MKKKQKPKKPSHPRKDFAEILADKLRTLNKGEVDEGSLSDDSGRWVAIRCDGVIFNFSFDMTGEKLDRFAVYREIIEVVDQEKIFEI